MKAADMREVANFKNNTNAVTPYTLGRVLDDFATQGYVADAISSAVIDPSQIDLTAYAKKTDLKTKLSQMINDDNYVQTVGGYIPSSVLPSYVDDVLEYSTRSSFPNPGESGKIYVALDTNLTYRWTGSAYTEISQSLALGETSSSAYRGDRGKIAYDHSQETGNAHNLALSDLGILATVTEVNYLQGLSTNIVTALDAKLSLSGGTMTGSLYLKGDPVQKLEAATKDYVDTGINGVSVTVSQHVTQISALEESVSGLGTSVGTISDTLVTVENDITGLNQTTATHTENISTLTSNVGGITSRVSAAETSITTLEATVNLLNVDFDRYYIVIPIDEDNKPLDTTTYVTNFELTFAGVEVTADDITITGTNTGVTCTVSGTTIVLSVNSDTAIPNTQNPFKLTFEYESGGVPYVVEKYLTLSTVPKGANGMSGENAINLHITSSEGLLFKEDNVSTDLTVSIHYGPYYITNALDLETYLGSNVYLQWKCKGIHDQDYTVIPASDSRLSNDGFTLTISTADVDNHITFICELKAPDKPDAYYREGEYVFDGTNFLDTGIKLFTQNNAQKNFYISFEIVSDTSTDNNATLMCAKNEVGTPWPGLDFRHKNTTASYFSKATNTTSYQEFTNLSLDITKVEFLRLQGVVYYKFTITGEEDFEVMLDMSSYSNYFDIPVTFGAGYNGPNKVAQRFYKGTLANMLVEIIDDDATIENYEDYI